jgi:hypothetical protein
MVRKNDIYDVYDERRLQKKDLVFDSITGVYHKSNCPFQSYARDSQSTLLKLFYRMGWIGTEYLYLMPSDLGESPNADDIADESEDELSNGPPAKKLRTRAR